MSYLKILDGLIPKRKCGAEVAAAAIAGGAGLFGSVLSSQQSSSNVDSQLTAQRQENQKNRDWQTSEAEKARQWQQGMVAQQNQFQSDLQNTQFQQNRVMQAQQAYYQSPVYQRQQLEAANINPQVYFGQQASFGGSSAPAGGSPSAPSAPSGANVGSVGGLNPVGFQPFGTSIGSIVSGLGNALQAAATARKLGIESDWLPSMLKTQVRNLTKDSELKSVLAVGQSIHNEVEKSTMPYAVKQAEANLYKSLAEADLSSAKTLTEDSVRKLNYALEKVQDSIKGLNDKEIQKLGLEMPFYVDLLKAKINELGASAEEKRASAGLHVSETEASDLANSVRQYGLTAEKVATLSKWIADADISDAKRMDALNKLHYLGRINNTLNEGPDARSKFVTTLYELFNVIGINAGVNLHN